MNISALWVILLYLWKEIAKSKSKLLFNYCMVIIAVNLTITFTNLMELMAVTISTDEDTYKAVSIVLGSTTGMGIGIARLSNRKLMQGLKEKLCRKKTNDPGIDSLLSVNKASISIDAPYLADYFDNITKKVREK